MKTLEKLVRAEILKRTEHTLDPIQFAYRPHRGVEDATVTLLSMLLDNWILLGFYLWTFPLLLTQPNPTF